MKRIIGIYAAAAFIAVTFYSGAEAAVDIYTFKKDRVDQDLEGNRGYLSGKPSNIPEKKRSSKRTLIGIDVELPVASSEEGAEKQEKVGSSDERAGEKHSESVETSPSGAETRTRPASRDVTDKNWIK